MVSSPLNPGLQPVESFVHARSNSWAQVSESSARNESILLAGIGKRQEYSPRTAVKAPTLGRSCDLREGAACPSRREATRRPAIASTRRAFERRYSTATASRVISSIAPDCHAEQSRTRKALFSPLLRRSSSPSSHSSLLSATTMMTFPFLLPPSPDHHLLAATRSFGWGAGERTRPANSRRAEPAATFAGRPPRCLRGVGKPTACWREDEKKLLVERPRFRGCSLVR